MIINKTHPVNYMIESKLKNKKFSLQFLPGALTELSKEKKIVFKGKNLKTAYLLDIIHNMLLKYFFKRNNHFPLNAIVLKERYGYLYNYYIRYLVLHEFITLKTQYKKGKTSRVYQLSPDLINGKILRYRNMDKILLKKYAKRYYQFEVNINDLIPKEIKDKLILDLYSVDVEYDKSLWYLNSLKSEKDSIYQRNKYSVDSINEDHIFYHFDHYGRMHTNFTILKSFIRKNCLLMKDEHTCEFDIPNSQPLFLSKLIEESETRWVRKEEFELFKALLKNGNFYQFLADKSNVFDRKKAKEMTYKVLFGKNHWNSKSDKIFSELFPSIHNFIKLYKEEHGDYRILAYSLQKMESNFIFKTVIKKIMLIDSNIPLITVHDSVITNKSNRDIVSNVFTKSLNDYFEW